MLHTFAYTVKIHFLKALIFRKVEDVKLPRSSIVAVDSRPCCAGGNRGCDLGKRLRWILLKLPCNGRRDSADSLKNGFGISWEIGVLSYAFERNPVLSRRIFVLNTREKLSVPVDVDGYSLDAVDNPAGLDINQDDVGVLAHDFDNESFAHSKTELVKSLDVHLYYSLGFVLLDSRYPAALDMLAKKHAEGRRLLRVSVLVVSQAHSCGLAADRHEESDIALPGVNLEHELLASGLIYLLYLA